MKKLSQILLALAFFGASSLLVHAQPAPKIATVDVVKLYIGYYKVEEQAAKFNEEGKRAGAVLEKMQAEGSALVEQYRELVEKTKNPALASEARSKAESDAQKKGEQIQAMQNEFNTLRENTERSLQERNKAFREVILEEISKTSTDIAKKRGANLLFDKSGPSLSGIPTLMYSDEAYEITDEVMQELNKNRPAKTTATPSPSVPSPVTAPTPTRSSDSPVITVPGAKK